MAIYRVKAPDGSIVRIKAPDDATQEQLAQAVKAYADAASVPAAPVEEPGVIDQAKDIFTGNLRETETTESLPDWAGMPELNQLSMASAKTGAGTILSSPEETAQIIKANFPEAQVRQDEKGNYVIKSSVDGKEYAIKPGFRVSDIPRALSALLAFTPAGRATTMTGAAGAGAATQATIEATQAAAGGEFNPADVAVAAAVPPAVIGTVNAVKAASAPMRQAVSSILNKGEAPPVNPAAAAPEVAPTAPAAPADPVAPMTGPELTQTTRKAVEGGMGSSRAKQVLAQQASPDPKVTEAAKRLGIDEYLQPDHVTTNQAYRELAQAVKSVPGSEARAAELRGLEQVAKRADDLIEEIGGTTDLSVLDASMRSRLQSTQSALEKEANNLYEKVNAAIPAKAPVAAKGTLDFLLKHADDLGGTERLLPVERKLLSALNGDKPLTYSYLDQTRKQIGRALGKMPAGPYANSETGLLKKLYSTLADDQLLAAESHGVADLYQAASRSVAVRKSLEKDLAALFGKDIDKSLLPGLRGAVRTIPSGDVSKLVKLTKIIPEDMRQEVVASGLQAAFNKSANQGNISFSTYANWYEGLLRNKQAYTLLMANLPQHSRKQLSDLYRVSKGISSATKERITTGRIEAVRQELAADGLMDNLYKLAKQSAVAETIGTMSGAPGLATALTSATMKNQPSAIKAADALISSDEFLSLVKQAGKPGEKAARLRLVHSKPFSRYVRAVGQPRELNERERWVLQAMQAQNQQQR